MKTIIQVIIVGILLTGCVASNQKFFSNIEQATDESYGYTADNPVTIKNADLNNSIGSSYYFLSRLRTENGNKLQMIGRMTVDNPSYQKPAVALQNRYNGQSLNNGGGHFLDLYLLQPENESDTLKIYINPYLKGKVMVPVGLQFVRE
ncbi:hypothetical protein D770_04895 [Flammeovirgaceae bacterium 311]|nr:hypothetical protein D770_04895 [Flammeovirgaceae bacterium 311]